MIKTVTVKFKHYINERNKVSIPLTYETVEELNDNLSAMIKNGVGFRDYKDHYIFLPASSIAHVFVDLKEDENETIAS